MKLFTKISLIIAAVAGGLGILAIILGLVMGANVYDLEDMGISISPNQLELSGVITEAVENAITSETKELVDEIGENVEEESIHIYHDVISGEQKNETEHNYIPTEEMIVQHHNETEHSYIPTEEMIVQHHNETKHNYTPTEERLAQHHNEKLHNYTCEFRGIERLEVDVQNAQITVFATENENEFMYYSNRRNSIAKVEGSTLKLEDKFNIRDKIELELYIPIGVLKEIEIEAVNGTISADRIVADNVNIEIDNASVQMDELIVENKAELQINAGQMIVGFYSGNNLETECAMGSIMVVCEGNQEDYNYDLECGMGQIQIQQDIYSGIGKDLKIHNESKKSIKAECAMGEIVLEFPNSL